MIRILYVVSNASVAAHSNACADIHVASIIRG